MTLVLVLVPDASNREKAQLSGGKKFDISRRNEIRGCQTGEKRSHDSKNLDSDDELEQKMIKIAEKQKFGKIDETSRLIDCKTVLLISISSLTPLRTLWFSK